MEKIAAAAIRPDDRVKSLSKRPGLLPNTEGDIVGRAAAMVC